ncbi:MAG: LytTR family transcriptional regulator DNA-binding domain-containing protein [Lachnospiraceae bacterium]|nr:LytTR family transcriptional regulator DNA-binding domain-containing protein [Lachnospiraceae bacterium]
MGERLDLKLDIEKITEGQESVTIRYRDDNPLLNRVVGILRDDKGKIWGKSDDRSLCVNIDEILYLESVEDKVFAYTEDNVLKIDSTLNSFMIETSDETFFRCSKSMIINVNRVVSLKSLSSNRIDAIMQGGEHIIISRRYASEFRRLLKGAR